MATPTRYRLDVLGHPCPFPLVEAAVALEQLEAGDELAIAFDCPEATRSLPAWAHTQGHEVTALDHRDGSWTITLRKA
ncbi:sulfurtransferase TusA family protein [Propioniciclava coleopterorum]|uniref:Sulfurtransferase TusA family protein n=1 Tax=Propioniciclava coleopterorum TaxID=2714937 RepID=A0A6G7YAJ2_9ACTN|nr:sulfurtransferase TusA family protein [Propioniciclava coleopterorum]